METAIKTTREVIMEQMQENTGRHMLDSGDHYGRNWQRNQTKTWEELTKEPVTTEAHVYKHGEQPKLELLGYVSLAAWLEANLDYDHDMQSRYEAWVESEGDPEDYDLANMDGFGESINDGTSWTGSDYPLTVNSYNGECDLTQTIQFVEFMYNDETYVLLQVHGGCDVRGGYTSPKAYRVKGDYFGRWNIDGYGCEFYQWDEDMSNANDYKLPNLKDYPVHDLVWVPTLKDDLEALKQTNMDNEETREVMRVNAAKMEQDYFDEFCAALDEDSVVVFKRKAYFVKGGVAAEIYAECFGLYD